MRWNRVLAAVLVALLAAATPAAAFSEAFSAGETYPDAWVCEICGELNIGDFCTFCGMERPGKSDEWECPECGEICTGRYCTNCGAPGPDVPPVSRPLESEPDTSSDSEPDEPEPTGPLESRYVRFAADYCGKSAAEVGFTSYDGRRRDRYGKAFITLNFVTAMGEFLDVENEDALKEYVVVAQNLKPGSEIELEFMLDDEGKEYLNLVDRTSVEEIDLLVKKAGDPAPDEAAFSLMVPVRPSPDRYTCYVRSYVGKNLASVGYWSDEGELTDEYGHGSVALKISEADGTVVEPEDRDWMSGYVVTAQSVEPNTEIRLEYRKDPAGKEYRFLVASQSINEITLFVEELPEEVLAREIQSGDGYEETDTDGDDGDEDTWNEGGDEPDAGD